jgi:ribonucleoside-diphosphate reductase alpha chain
MTEKHIMVTKRDGSVVPFDPEKLTRWAKWAGNIGVDWFGIVADTYKKLPDTCTTKDLQQAMIQACMDYEDTPHMLMAGRLLIGDVYKQAFGGHDKIPSVHIMYAKMVADGLWEEMEYSWGELRLAEDFINHERDLNSVYSVVNQITTKYAIKDIEKNIVLESPAFVWMRMALGVCKDEPKETRMKSVQEFYEDFATGRINAPTPNINNLGTPKRTYASCCVYKSNDELGSLAAGDHIATIMTASSAGIGGMLMTRSKGDGVRKNTIRHGGKLPYYNAQASAVNANLQGGRGGAETMHINALDPEIETLLRLRHPTTVASKAERRLDYSFGFHPLLAEKAAKNEQWMNISYKVNPNLWEAMYRDDGSFERLYAEHEKSSKRKKFIPARKLALEFLRIQEETGRMYEHNTYEMNRHTPFKDVIYSSNLCVAPETLILTSKGYVPIVSVTDKFVDVWNGSEWSNVQIKQTGHNVKLIKVVTDAGQTIHCTPEHKFYLPGIKTPIAAKDLKAGIRLVKPASLPVVNGSESLENSYANGFFSGDGSVEDGRQKIYFYGAKQALMSLFGDLLENVKVQPDLNRAYGYTKKLRQKFFVPDATFSVQSRISWLEGIMDADGCVSENNGAKALNLTSVNKKFLLQIQLMLQTTGVPSRVGLSKQAGVILLPKNDGTGAKHGYSCKDAYSLYIGNSGLHTLISLGFSPKRLDVSGVTERQDGTRFTKVTEVVDEGRYDDTYCFTEPKRHMGMFNGILTGQCQEIGLPTQGYKDVTELYRMDDDVQGEIGLCNLGAIVAGRVIPEMYEEVAYRTLKMVDNVISIMDYPFPHLKYTAQARRSAGIGITNLAHDMAVKGLRYDTAEGKAYMHRLAEMHSYWLHKASVRLAKERGKCDWFHKTKYADGWLPIDTYCKHIDNVTDQPLLCDWEGLRKEIAKHGMRNSVLEAYMPVESSSIAGNTTNSIYPVRELVVVKTSGTNKNVFLAPDLEELEDAYQLAWTVPAKDITEMYGIFQKFCGQAISADKYRTFPAGVTPKIRATEMFEDWLYRITCGHKSCYYSNSKAGLTLEEDEADCESCKL